MHNTSVEFGKEPGKLQRGRSLFLADFESCRECLHLRRSVTNLHNCYRDHLKRQCHVFFIFYQLISDCNSEGSETKRLPLFRPLFHKLRMEARAIAFSPAKPVRCMHKIMLDCTLIFQITSKTAFSWLKMLNTFGCNRQRTEKTLKERTLSMSIIHVHTRAHIAPTKTQTQLAQYCMCHN